MASGSTVTVHFFEPSPALRPYFTAFYLTEIALSPGAAIDDFLHPEWAALRFTQGTPPHACVGPGPLRPQWPFVANGPTSKAIHFANPGPARIWGLGLQPRGWAKFVPASAHALADRTVDGAAHPAFADFAPLAGLIFARAPDPAGEAARIDAYLLTLAQLPVPHEQAIAACHAAVLDPEVSTVATLGERVGLPPHSLERLCRRYFGFAPRLLLRRQRFLRSLATFMLEGARSWVGALDGQYHDQAQFVRDFRGFMGLTPRQYAALPHPILHPIMRQRMTDAGAVAGIDLPTVARYGRSAGAGFPRSGE